jgi:maltooligosyltrehalose synthase
LREQSVVVVVPRFTHTLMDGAVQPPLGDAWQDTSVSLPSAGVYLNVLNGEVNELAGARSLLCRELFARFPVALLVNR